MDKEKRKGVSMVALHPPIDGTLQPVEAHAVACGMTAAAYAGMCRAKRWAPGKQVTAAEFEAARAAFERRPLGSGGR